MKPFLKTLLNVKGTLNELIMKVKDLKKLLNDIDENAEVYIEEVDPLDGNTELKPAFASKCIVRTYINKGKLHRVQFLGNGKIDESHVEAIRII